MTYFAGMSQNKTSSTVKIIKPVNEALKHKILVYIVNIYDYNFSA